MCSSRSTPFSINPCIGEMAVFVDKERNFWQKGNDDFFLWNFEDEKKWCRVSKRIMGLLSVFVFMKF